MQYKEVRWSTQWCIIYVDHATRNLKIFPTASGYLLTIRVYGD